MTKTLIIYDKIDKLKVRLFNGNKYDTKMDINFVNNELNDCTSKFMLVENINGFSMPETYLLIKNFLEKVSDVYRDILDVHNYNSINNLIDDIIKKIIDQFNIDILGERESEWISNLKIDQIDFKKLSNPDILLPTVKGKIKKIDNISENMIGIIKQDNDCVTIKNNRYIVIEETNSSNSLIYEKDKALKGDIVFYNISKLISLIENKIFRKILEKMFINSMFSENIIKINNSHNEDIPSNFIKKLNNDSTEIYFIDPRNRYITPLVRIFINF